MTKLTYKFRIKQDTKITYFVSFLSVNVEVKKNKEICSDWKLIKKEKFVFTNETSNTEILNVLEKELLALSKETKIPSVKRQG